MIVEKWIDMFAGRWLYQTRSLSALVIFVTCGISAIVFREPILLIIPFAWILAPLIIANPGKLFWLLLIMLPLSTELNITPQLGLDFPDEPLMILLTGIFLVKIIHQPGLLSLKTKQHPLLWWLVVYAGWILICCLYSVEPLLSFKFLLAKLWYIVPFVLLPVVLVKSKKDLRDAALCLLLPMQLLVIQVLYRQSLNHFSFENIKLSMAPFFRNHVNYSSMLVCLLAVGWCVWKLTERTTQKWVFIGLMIGLAGLLFSYSRGAWIALVAGIAAIWVVRKKLMPVLVLLAVASVVVSTAWLVTDRNYLRFAPDHDRTIFHTDFGEHLKATVHMKDVSTAERFYRWVAGVRMLADKPVTGFGPNSFYPHYRSYTVGRFETWVSDNKEHSTVHNYFLLTALEQGIPGLLLFCILYFGMLLRVQKLYHRLTDPFYRTIALTIGIVLIMIGVINSLSDMIETDKIGSLFWLCLGMIIWLDTSDKQQVFL